MNPNAATFELFPRLPQELRLQIWELSLSPRVVNLIYDEKYDKYFSFNSKPPAILHASRESRAVGLKVDTLKLAFGTDSHEPSIYFDFARDTLFLDDWLGTISTIVWRATYENPHPENQLQVTCYPEVGPMTAHELEAIEHLAVSSELFAMSRGYNVSNSIRSKIERLLSSFKNIKTLFIVFEPGDLYPTFDEPIRFLDITARTKCAIENEASHTRRAWCPVCRLRRRCTKELPGVNEPDYPDPDAIPLKLPDINLVAAYRGSCPPDLGCLELDSLGAPSLTTAPLHIPPKTFASGAGSDFDTDSDSDVDPRDGETTWEDRSIEGSSSDDEDDFEEENSDLAAELEGELSDIVEDETKYKAQVGYQVGKGPQSWWVGSDYYEKRASL